MASLSGSLFPGSSGARTGYDSVGGWIAIVDTSELDRCGSRRRLPRGGRGPLTVPGRGFAVVGRAVDGTKEAATPGTDASFVLYEDEGTNYNYENGMSSKIAFHWNDAKKELEIAARSGTFPGIQMEREFQVNLVVQGLSLIHI